MKIIVTIFVTAVVTWGINWVITSSLKPAPDPKTGVSAAAHSNQTVAGGTTANPSKLAPPKSGEPRMTNAHAVAQQCLQKLTLLRPAAGPTRQLFVRQIIHQLETLVDLGEGSLPAIKEFLDQLQEVDYAVDSVRAPDLANPDGKVAGVVPGWTQLRSRGDSLLPPTLRLGLVDVLKRIGTPQAQQVLADMLSKTGRGVEVAYVVKALQELAPDHYRELALTVTRDLLNNPPRIPNPSRLDDNSKGYLLEVLALFNDQSFINNVNTQIMTPSGQLDRSALDYLTKSMKEQAMPAVYQAFRDPRLTNHWEKATLVNVALNYVGQSADANTMFADLVTNSSLPLSMRTMAIQNILGTQQTQGRTEDEARQAQQHLLSLLESIRGNASEETLTRALDDGIMLLENRISGGLTNLHSQTKPD